MSEQVQSQTQEVEAGEVVKDIVRKMKKVRKRSRRSRGPVSGAPLINRIRDVRKNLAKVEELLGLVERYPAVFPAFELAWKDANKSVRELIKLLKR